MRRDAEETAPGDDDGLPVPDRLPFLASLSWFDRDYRKLAPLDMLRRYEAGWRHLGTSLDRPREL